MQCILKNDISILHKNNLKSLYGITYNSTLRSNKRSLGKLTLKLFLGQIWAEAEVYDKPPCNVLIYQSKSEQVTSLNLQMHFHELTQRTASAFKNYINNSLKNLLQNSHYLPVLSSSLIRKLGNITRFIRAIFKIQIIRKND